MLILVPCLSGIAQVIGNQNIKSVLPKSWHWTLFHVETNVPNKNFHWSENSRSIWKQFDTFFLSVGACFLYPVHTFFEGISRLYHLILMDFLTILFLPHIAVWMKRGLFYLETVTEIVAASTLKHAGTRLCVDFRTME